MPELRPLDACLQGAPTLSQVLAHAKLLSRAQQVLSSVAPPALANACCVANLRQGELVIHAENGAVAAKIRQLGGRLCRELLFQGIDCTAIIVRVQDGGLPHPPAGPAVRPLSEGARQSLAALAEELPNTDSLRQRLEELLRRTARPAAE
jgi:hypothetical protein